MKLLSLCTGYGGLDLAAEAYFGAELIGCADIDKSASIAIEKHFSVPNYGDIRNIVDLDLEFDILTAGYPCQPFSEAGSRKGSADERHIWPHIAEIIGKFRPRIVVLENVRGHLSLGFREVLADLARLGYDAKWRIVRASDVGAPHHRARIFVVSYPNDIGRIWDLPGSPRRHDSCGQSECASDSQHQHRTHNRQVPELGRRFASRHSMSLQATPDALVDGKLNPKFVEYMMGLPAGWVTDLPISRNQQFKLLGNGVVPQQAYYALQLLCD